MLSIIPSPLFPYTVFLPMREPHACENIPFGLRPHSRQVAALFASPISSWLIARKSPIKVSGS